MDCNLLTNHFTLARGINFPGDGFWYVKSICYEKKLDGTISVGKQIAYQYQGHEIYERYSNLSGVWSHWEKCVTSSDLQITGYKKLLDKITDLFTFRGEYAITEGYVTFKDSRVAVRSRIFVTINYSAGISTYFVNVQPMAGQFHVYLRNLDGSIPDGITVSLSVLVVNI